MHLLVCLVRGHLCQLVHCVHLCPPASFSLLVLPCHSHGCVCGKNGTSLPIGILGLTDFSVCGRNATMFIFVCLWGAPSNGSGLSVGFQPCLWTSAFASKTHIQPLIEQLLQRSACAKTWLPAGTQSCSHAAAVRRPHIVLLVLQTAQTY